MKIEIKNRWTGKVIFAHEEEENSVKITVLAALKAKIDLSGSDLSDSNLSGSDLSGSNLSGSAICFSSGWTFSCRHSRFKFSTSFVYQVLAHLCSCTSDDQEWGEIREAILPYALKSQRANELGLSRREGYR